MCCLCGAWVQVLTVFHVQDGGIDVERDETQAVGEDFVGDDGGVAPYVHAFYTYRRYLLKSACMSARTEGGHASAMRMRRKALAMDASTPTRSKSMERFERRSTRTTTFYIRSNELIYVPAGEKGTDLFELGEIPSIVLVCVMSWKVCRGDVRDAFWVDADMTFGIEASHIEIT